MLQRILMGIVLTAAVAPAGAAQTVDDIIAKHMQARGGIDKLKAIRSMRMTGKMTAGPSEAPAILEVKRPNQMRIEFTVQGMTGVRAFDGKAGWMLMPFMGKNEPEAMSADDVKDAEEQADFDGPLVDYKSKGHSVELAGKESVEGTDTYKLKLTLKSGDVRYVYLDTESHLQIRTQGKRTVRGAEIEFESSVGDYKEVGGLMLPHAFEGGIKGSPQKQKIAIDKIELNVEVDDARFKMPEVKKSGPTLHQIS